MMYAYDILPINTNAKEYKEGYRCAKNMGCQADNPYHETQDREKYRFWLAGWWDFVDEDIEKALKEYAEPWG